MIDFRYHIVSIVAVLLALSAGVVLGSGLLGGPLLDDIQRRADDIRATNEELRDLAAERQQRLERQDEFAEAAGPYLLPGALDGVKVTIIEVEGTSEALREGALTNIALAGGEVMGTVRILDEIELKGEIEVDELALALGSTSGDADDLRLELATTLGARLAAASQVGSGPPGSQAAARGRLETLLGALSEAGFVKVEETGDGPLVPTSTTFLILAGGERESSYDLAAVLSRFAGSMASRDRVVVVGETETSMWNVIQTLRETSEVAERIATVSGADSAFGRIAMVLTIRGAIDGDVGHHGVGPGADVALPSPAPSASPSE